MSDLSTELLIAIAAGAFSFFFAYFPGVKDWFENLDPQWKPLINAGALLVCTVGYLLYQCQAGWECILANWQVALWIWIKALIENQGAYLVFVKQAKRKELFRRYSAFGKN